MSTENDDTTPNVEHENHEAPAEIQPSDPAFMDTQPTHAQPTQAQPTLAQPTQAQPTLAQPTVEPSHKHHGALIAVAVATAAVVCIGGLGTAAVAVLTSHPSTTGTQHSSQGTLNLPGNFGGDVRGGQALGEQAVAGETAATASTDAQKVGVVTIYTTLDYTAQDQAAGTGMIISSNGYILTNNHVVESSTSIKVTVESTGQTYTAKVVGTDAAADVAVLKLQGASGLSSVHFDSKEKVTVGESIYSVGNAEGTGNLVTATGTVGAVNQNLTVGSESSAKQENLTGLIQLESDVVSGDSGGPLFDTKGDVIGIVTAASTGSANVTGYAINIAQVLKVAKDIESGTPATGIVFGYPAFLGIELASGSSAAGVPVAGTFRGMPAEAAGLAKGDVITAVNGQAVSTSDGLSAAITAHKVGDRVTISWLDSEGGQHSSTVTLVAGPAA
jgi:S1-C subfamily serine protease